MSFALPAHLQKYKDKYQFRIVPATVVKVRQWSESHMSGGGNESIFGSDIKTRIVDKNEIWLRKPDGKEFSAQFSGQNAVDVNMREGHKIFLIYYTDKKGVETLSIIVNFSTDMTSILKTPLHNYSIWGMIFSALLAMVIGVLMAALWPPLGLLGMAWLVFSFKDYMNSRVNYKPTYKQLIDIRDYCLSHDPDTAINQNAIAG